MEKMSEKHMKRDFEAKDSEKGHEENVGIREEDEEESEEK